MLFTTTSAPHHKHIGCIPSSLRPHASCVLLWWQGNGYWVHRGKIPVRQMMCPVHFVFHNPLAELSIRTLLWMHLLIIRSTYLLPLSGCKCALVVTLWQTSVARDAVMSHIMLCCVVEPPMWQTMAWHTVSVAAQLHVWEVFVRLHSYLKHGESQNSSLWRWNS